MNINIKPVSGFVQGVKKKWQQFTDWNTQPKFEEARKRGHKNGANNNWES